MTKATEKIWTHDVCLVLDVHGYEEEAEELKVGTARLAGGNFVIELAPGISVSGKIILKVREKDAA